MQRERIEEFIEQNREAFDDAIPGLQVWSGIGQELDRRRHRRHTIWQVSRIAAAIVVLLAIGAVVGAYLQSQQSGAVASLEAIAPEYAELEDYYQEEVRQKYQQLASYQHQSVVDKDLAELDEVLEELRRELLVAPRGKEEEIIENLIRSYQAKISILERVLERVEPGASELPKENNNEQRSI